MTQRILRKDRRASAERVAADEQETIGYTTNNGGVCTVPHENGSFLCQMKALIVKLTGLKY